MKSPYDMFDFKDGALDGKHSYPIRTYVDADSTIQAYMDYMDGLGFSRRAITAQPGGLEMVLETNGWSAERIEKSVAIQKRIAPLLRGFTLQNNIFIMAFQWDWFIYRIGRFALWGLEQENSPLLLKGLRKDLQRITALAVLKQVAHLELACDLKDTVTAAAMEDIEELGLMRNIGAHNRWEVDEKYMDKTKTVGPTGPWKIGEYRVYGDAEWLKLNVSMRRDGTWKIAEAIAVRFKDLGDFPEG